MKAINLVIMKSICMSREAGCGILSPGSGAIWHAQFCGYKGEEEIIFSIVKIT